MKPSLRIRFGQRFRELRQDSGFSQEAIADKCGFSRSYMSRIERGMANPSLDVIEALANVLHVMVSDLFVREISGWLGNAKEPAILVPFASDGSCFNPSLCKPSSGMFTVGEKCNEVMFNTFDSALESLKSMATAKWRRPNRAGNWGIVSAVRWDQLPKKYRNAR